MNFENFNPHETSQNMAEIQYQQDVETLKGVLANIDTRQLGEEIKKFQDKVYDSPDNIHNEGILTALNLIQQLVALQNWDDLMSRYAKNNLAELAAVSGTAENLEDNISSAVVVAARAIERLAEVKFPEVIEQNKAKMGGMSEEEMDQAKKRVERTNIS